MDLANWQSGSNRIKTSDVGPNRNDSLHKYGEKDETKTDDRRPGVRDMEVRIWMFSFLAL